MRRKRQRAARPTVLGSHATARRKTLEAQHCRVSCETHRQLGSPWPEKMQWESAAGCNTTVLVHFAHAHTHKFKDTNASNTQFLVPSSITMPQRRCRGFLGKQVLLNLQAAETLDHSGCECGQQRAHHSHDECQCCHMWCRGAACLWTRCGGSRDAGCRRWLINFRCFPTARATVEVLVI